MNIEPFGQATATQHVRRGLIDSLVRVSNWIFLCAAVLIYRKNPARFMLFLISLAIHLVWLLITNHIRMDLRFLFFFDVSLFYLAFSILLLPWLRTLKQRYQAAFETALLIAVVGMHLLIYGKFWYRIYPAILLISPMVSFLIACGLSLTVPRKIKLIANKPILLFTLFNLFSALIVSVGAVAVIWLHDLITSYIVRLNLGVYLRYDMIDMYISFLIFYAVCTPFLIFVHRNRFYRAIIRTKADSSTRACYSTAAEKV